MNIQGIKGCLTAKIHQKHLDSSQDILYTRNMETSELIRIATAAERKGISRQSLDCAIKRGDLAVTEIDGVKFVAWSDVEAYKPRSYRSRLEQHGKVVSQ